MGLEEDVPCMMGQFWFSIGNIQSWWHEISLTMRNKLQTQISSPLNVTVCFLERNQITFRRVHFITASPGPHPNANFQPSSATLLKITPFPTISVSFDLHNRITFPFASVCKTSSWTIPISTWFGKSYQQIKIIFGIVGVQSTRVPVVDQEYCEWFRQWFMTHSKRTHVLLLARAMLNESTPCLKLATYRTEMCNRSRM